MKSVETGFTIKGRVLSSSMEPLLKKGMWLKIKKTDFDQIRIGDIVCFIKKEDIIGGVKKNKLYVHRVIGTKRENQELVTKGDNMPSRDLPVQKQKIIGKVVSFRVKNKDYYLETIPLKLLNWLFTIYSIIGSHSSLFQKLPKGRRTLVKLIYGY